MEMNFRQIFLPKTTVEEILKRPPHQRLNAGEARAILEEIELVGQVPIGGDSLIPLDFDPETFEAWTRVLKGESQMNLNLAEAVNRVFLMAAGWPLEKYSV